MDVYQLNRKFREELLRREYRPVRNVLRAYERSWKSIHRQLDALTRRIDEAIANGETFSPSWFYQEQRFTTLFNEINSRYQQLAAECTEFTKAGVKVAAPLGAKHAYRMGKSVAGSFAGLHSKAVEAIVASVSDGPVRALFLNLGTFALREASRILIDGMVGGDNPRVVARRLVQGIKELTKQRAVLIARTEMIRTYRIAQQSSYQLNSDVLSGWRWTCAKTRATCPLCLAMDGEIFPVTETLSSHPACRCAMVPVPLFDFGGPQPVSGSEWFDKLPAFAQNHILRSPTKGQMYRAGGFELKDLVKRTYNPRWGGSYSARSIRELKELARSGSLRSSHAAPPPLSGFTPPPRTVIQPKPRFRFFRKA